MGAALRCQGCADRHRQTSRMVVPLGPLETPSEYFVGVIVFKASGLGVTLNVFN